MNEDMFDLDILNTEERGELPDSVFGIPQLRKYPMPDARHVVTANAYFYKAPDQYKAELARKILHRAKEFGIDIKSPEVYQWAKK